MLQFNAGGLGHLSVRLRVDVVFIEYVITKLTEEHSSLCDCWRAERLTDALTGVCVCMCVFK